MLQGDEPAQQVKGYRLEQRALRSMGGVGLLLHDSDLLTAPCEGFGEYEAGRPRPDDDNVRMSVHEILSTYVAADPIGCGPDGGGRRRRFCQSRRPPTEPGA
ncbi:hypothetical protein P405_16535 [Streptomyces sp. FR-008]|nr:hypothetical protein P405_16535 [Streptomyces sp. FR-008]